MEPVDVTAHMDMAPYKVLSMNIDPGLQAVREAAERNLAMRNWRLQNAAEFAQKQALQQAQIQADKDIAQWHERVANIREDTMNNIWDKRIQAQAAAASAAEKKRIEMLDEQELNREARSYATGQVDGRTGMFIPPIPRLANESTQGYVTRAATERAKLDAQRQGLIDKNTALLTGRINKLVQDSEDQNQAAAHSAGVGAVNQMLSGLKPAVQQQFKGALQKLTAAGVPYPQALEQIEKANPMFTGVTDAYAQKAATTLASVRSLRNPMVQTQVESMGSLIKNPAALSRSDFGDLLDEHPSQQPGKTPFALVPAGGGPAPTGPSPTGVTALSTGIPSVDNAIQANQLRTLSDQRNAIAAKLAGVNRGIDSAVQNPTVTRSFGGLAMGQPVASFDTSAPMYASPEDQAKAILSLRSQAAPLQQQLDSVNDQTRAIGGDFQ